MSKASFLVIFILTIFLSGITSVNAAVINLIPEVNNVKLGQEFNLYINLNTEGVGVNAAEVTLSFPKDIVEIVDVDKTKSIFNFWVKEPFISNEEGILTFIAGTPKGVSGENLLILAIKLKAQKDEDIEVKIVDATVTASDGKGTDVFSFSNNSRVIITNGGETPSVSPTAPETIHVITREAVSAKNTPNKPELRVGLYTNQTRWYNHVDKTVVFWDLTSDVVSVAADIDHSPYTEPETIIPELVDGKDFGLLDEGVWYIHVQFKNNVGWGKITHYKISLDRTPPTPFEILINNIVSDDPSPKISYQGHDALSGISHTSITLDGGVPSSSEQSEEEFSLPLQTPGKHTIAVKLFDMAGNSVEDSLIFEILPITAPTVYPFTENIYKGEELFITGLAEPEVFVVADILNKKGEKIFTKEVGVTETGHWLLTIEEDLPLGKYNLTIFSRDDRGAQSYPGDPFKIKIKPQPVVVIGFIDLTMAEVVIGLLLILSLLISITAWRFVLNKRVRDAYTIIARRDINKMNNLLKEDINALDKILDMDLNLNEITKSRSKAIITKINKTINTMGKYLREEVQKIK